jgi:glucose-1-phosphate adenylyltransferase
MGNYVFRADTLIEAVSLDAKDEDSKHDLGGNIIPMMVERGGAEVYDFADNEVPGATDRDRGYWRDVGTLDAYYEASMDLIQVDPTFNLYDPLWPLRTYQPQFPPAKFVFDQEGRRGEATDSLVSMGCIVSGSKVTRSILSPGVRVHSYCTVEDSIVMPNATINRYARLRRAIIDRNVLVPRRAVIGFDAEEDRRRHTVSEGGVVVVTPGEECFVEPEVVSG